MDRDDRGDLARTVALTRSGLPGSRPVVLVHGFGCDQTVWDALRPGLEADHDVLSYDQVGSGASDLSAYDERRYGRLDGYVDDLLSLLRRLDLRDVALVGHSIGGAVAMLAAVAEPERVSALVLIASSPRYLDDEGYHGGFSQADLDQMFDLLDASYGQWTTDMGRLLTVGHDAALAQDVAERFVRTSYSVARRFARVSFGIDLRAELGLVRVPTLVVQTEDDFVVPRSVAVWMSEQIPGSRLAALPTTGHLPHLSDPDQTLRVVREHLVQTSSRA